MLPMPMRAYIAAGGLRVKQGYERGLGERGKSWIYLLVEKRICVFVCDINIDIDIDFNFDLDLI
jgi:hypothetical protein